jgi:hypothetical protein
MEREQMEQERFEAWGIVDLFGHTRLAGRISTRKALAILSKQK